jgi:2-methylcitrate dehydratase PrpD
MAMANDGKTDAQPENDFLTRRTVLQSAGMAVAAAAFPFVGEVGAVPPASPAPQGQAAPATEETRAELPISDVMTRLSTYMSEARDRAVPENVMEKMKEHVIDTFAAMVSGSELLPGQVALNFVRAYRGNPVATVVADTTVCGPIEAALVNGVMAHADETDDTAGGPWHPGCNVVPAALALGEQFGISGEHFLRAVVLGYDIGPRVLTTVAPGLPNSHRLVEGLGGIFGVTAAASCAASLTAQQMRWSLSYTAQQCSGVSTYPRDLDHIEKGFIFGGMGARSGVTSALLVHASWNAVNDIMSGTDNFLLAYAPTANPELLVDKLGENYGVMNSNIKRWTVGQPIQAVLDAGEALLKKQSIDPTQIREIVIRSAPGAITDNSGPSDINMQHALAVMLIDKTVTFKSIHDKARMHEPATLRLRMMTRLDPGPPGARGGAPGGGRGPAGPLLQITLADGTRLTQDATGPGLGSANNPMTREQLVAKCHDLMAPVLGAAPATRLINTVLALEKTKNILELRPLLQRARQSGPPKLSEYPNAKS